MHVKLIDSKENCEKQHEISGGFGVVVKGKCKDVEECYEVEYASLYIVGVFFDFYGLFKFDVGCAEISISQIVQIVVVYFFRHYFFQALDLLEYLLAASVVRVVHSQRTFKGMPELFRLVNS